MQELRACPRVMYALEVNSLLEAALCVRIALQACIKVLQANLHVLSLQQALTPYLALVFQ